MQYKCYFFVLYCLVSDKRHQFDKQFQQYIKLKLNYSK